MHVLQSDVAAKPPAPTTTGKRRVAIFLLQLGGPKTLEDIAPFLEELFTDVLPLPGFCARPISRLIAKRRTPAVRPLYAEIGGGSPLLANTEAQADALKAALAKVGIDAETIICMRYAPPRYSDALTAARALGDDVTWVALPLYPQYSYATTRSSLDELYENITDAEADRLHVIESYPQEPHYVQALVQGILDKLHELPAEQRKDAHLVFSAHGLPLQLVRQGDPYPQHIAMSVHAATAGVAAALGYTPRVTLSFQSRVGPVKWLTPSTEETLKRLGAEGEKVIVVIPVAFVSEHIETLQELDIELRDIAAEAGVTTYVRVPTVSVQPSFIASLVAVTQAALTLGPAPAGRYRSSRLSPKRRKMVKNKLIKST